jgi:CHAD domain-containing protein
VLVRGLRSARFRRFVGGWRGFLEAAGDSVAGPEGGRPIRDVADRRLTKAIRRVLTHGGGLGDEPSAESLHRLRIDCKKLRYLLEFFGGLYPSGAIQPAVKQLKGLQDALGGFNDMVVQRRQLVELAAELMGAPDTPPETLLAMGRLDIALEQRGEAFRRTFHDVFGAFADAAIQRPLAETVAPGETRP